MNKIFIFLLFISFSSLAGQITVPLSDEYVSGDTKYCIYSHGGENYTDAVDTYKQCKYTETFETDEQEERFQDLKLYLLKNLVST